MPHLLKRLELNGFKSFAGRTVLEFPAGIIAIVGPNGSGKTNIVEGIRWLLGERDSKNLRGGKVEDLIFAGTPKRARVGVASASLYFENKNKFFPVDFEEVVVTRQISRGGDSKYYLNKSEVLLRDLIDFFAKARLGSRGMVIIGQGNSDLFVRSTPTERREMIEEVLGLREYQIKKADAERRLKNTRINLDKTKALIEEILPHLRSLKRQTSRWERRGALEEELQTLEGQFFGSQLHEIAVKMAVAEESIAANKKQFDALEKELHDAEDRQIKVESSQPEEKRELAKIKESVRALLERRSALQKDLGRLEVQIEIARAQPATVGATGGVSQKNGGSTNDDDELDKLTDLIKKLKTELELALNEDPRELQAVVETIIEEMQFAIEDAGRREKRAAKASERGAIPESIKKEFEKLTSDLRALEKELGDLRTQEKSLEESQEGFYNVFKEAVAAVQAAKNKIGEWENASRARVLEKERLDLRRNEVLRQIEQAGRRAEDFLTTAAKTSGAPAAAKKIESFSAAELQDMEKRLFRLRGELASIGEVDQALMKEAQDTETRYAFLSKESEDLEKAVTDLTALMHELSEKIKTEFDKSLHKINDAFNEFFRTMFGDGAAKLKVQKPKEAGGASDSDEDESGAGADGVITDAKDDGANEIGGPLLPQKPGGVEIELKLARKRITSLDALSGGERSLVGIAALFAMVSVSPPPFLVLDEIDAPLDERNARRFSEMLKNFSKHTQFLVVTHNRATMEAADILYGVTLAEDGSSKVVSLKLEG
jgi:chromosome segregation ATPase